MINKGLLIVISGPSGSGKDTIIEELFSINKNLVKSVSATTRLARMNETNGKDYFFISEKEFCEIVSNEGMLEYTKYCENYYGTLKEQVEKLIEEGKDVILKIEVDGAKQIKKKCKESINIFILPPSMEVLTERLIKRGTENNESLKRRLNRAKEEIKFSSEYDYIVINNDINSCAKDICNIINAEKYRSNRMKNIISEVLLQCENHQ